MQCRHQSAPPWKFNLKLWRVLKNPFVSFYLHLCSCSCAHHKCQIKQLNTLFSSTWQSFSFLQSITSVTSIVLVARKILLFKRKWQMRVTECESSTNFSKAGVGRDRMQIGNVTGRSICTLQAVLLANAGINEYYPWAALGLQAAIRCTQVYHILKSLECLWATMSSHWLWEWDISDKGPL